jgi:Protein of unknown function (DUF3024)
MIDHGILRLSPLDVETVTLSSFEIKRYEKLVAEFIERRRPPPRLRKDVDLAFRIDERSLEIFEVRAHWTGKGKPIEHSIAKAKFDKTKQKWKVLWQRADLKWHSYNPHPEVDAIEDFLMIVGKDDQGCFFG